MLNLPTNARLSNICLKTATSTAPPQGVASSTFMEGITFI